MNQNNTKPIILPKDLWPLPFDHNLSPNEYINLNSFNKTRCNHLKEKKKIIEQDKGNLLALPTVTDSEKEQLILHERMVNLAMFSVWQDEQELEKKVMRSIMRMGEMKE